MTSIHTLLPALSHAAETPSLASTINEPSRIGKPLTKVAADLSDGAQSVFKNFSVHSSLRN